MKIKNKEYVLKFKGFILNRNTIEQLKNYYFSIHWNNLDCNYWIYDFKINNKWYTAYKIDMTNRTIYLKRF